MAVFILEDALSVCTNLGKHSLFVWLFVSSIKTGTRHIIHLDELSSVLHRSSRTTEDSSSRRIIRLVPVFTIQTNNQTNNECLPKFIQTDKASSSIKTANDERVKRWKHGTGNPFSWLEGKLHRVPHIPGYIWTLSLLIEMGPHKDRRTFWPR